MNSMNIANRVNETGDFKTKAFVNRINKGKENVWSVPNGYIRMSSLRLYYLIEAPFGFYADTFL
jgi:hypothetical protein